MEIRKGRIEDLKQITANNLAMARETEGKVLNPKVVEKGTAAVLRGDVEAAYYVAEEGGRIISQLMVTREWSDWRNAYFWWLQSVYTLPEERGKGVFRRLFLHVFERARKAGACGLRLYVDRENTPAMGVYEALGMKATDYEIYEVEF